MDFQRREREILELAAVLRLCGCSVTEKIINDIVSCNVYDMAFFMQQNLRSPPINYYQKIQSNKSLTEEEKDLYTRLIRSIQRYKRTNSQNFADEIIYNVMTHFKHMAKFIATYCRIPQDYIDTVREHRLTVRDNRRSIQRREREI